MKNFTILIVLLAAFAVSPKQLSAQELPGDWSNKDIGAPGTAGSAIYDPDTGLFTIKGSGLNFWDTDDAQLVYVRITGDFTFKTRVVTFTSPAMGGSAKTGINARNSLDKDAPSIMMAWENWGGLATTTRMGPGITPTWVGANFPGADAIPWYLKMVRLGDQFTTFESYDDTTWTQTDSQAMTGMLATIYVGLAVSPNNAELATATFDKVTISGTIVAGIEDIEVPGDRLTVYPNPALNEVSINYAGDAPVQSVIIMDVTGKKVREIIPGSKNIIVDVKDLSPGLYFIKAFTTEGVLNRNFVRR